MRLLRSYSFGLGLTSALSLDDLGREWADAASLYEAQVDDLAFEINAGRMEARAMKAAMNRGEQWTNMGP